VGMQCRQGAVGQLIVVCGQVSSSEFWSHGKSRRVMLAIQKALGVTC
jgi:hypothetical protein